MFTWYVTASGSIAFTATILVKKHKILKKWLGYSSQAVIDSAASSAQSYSKREETDPPSSDSTRLSDFSLSLVSREQQGFQAFKDAVATYTTLRDRTPFQNLSIFCSQEAMFGLYQTVALDTWLNLGAVILRKVE
jgi:hypothetical protein